MRIQTLAELNPERMIFSKMNEAGFIFSICGWMCIAPDDSKGVEVSGDGDGDLLCGKLCKCGFGDSIDPRAEYRELCFPGVSAGCEFSFSGGGVSKEVSMVEGEALAPPKHPAKPAHTLAAKKAAECPRAHLHKLFHHLSHLDKLFDEFVYVLDACT